MAGEERVADLDPFELLDRESERVAQFFQSSPDWSAPTRCEGWDIKDLLAHVGGVERYHLACLDDSLGELFEEMSKQGANDLDGFNAVPVAEGRSKSTDELFDIWRTRNLEVRKRMRERGRDGSMTSSVGPYPVGSMAFHVASEYATHGDDMDVSLSDADRAARTEWRSKVSEFAVLEAEKPVSFRREGSAYSVSSEDVSASLPVTDFVEAVTARLPKDHPLDPKLRQALRALA